MAYSTQKEFFHVPFMNETIEFECRKECVHLKSYSSTYDDRSWANNDNKKSRYLTDLVACRTHILDSDDELSENVDHIGERSFHRSGSNKSRSKRTVDGAEASGSKQAGGRGERGGKAEKGEGVSVGGGKGASKTGISGKGPNTGIGVDDGDEQGGITGDKKRRDTALIHSANEAMKRLENMLLENKKLEEKLNSTNKRLSETVDERDQLRKRLEDFSEMEKKVAELQRKAEESTRNSLQITQNLDKQSRYIENMEAELKKTEDFYEDKIKTFVHNEQHLRRQICSLKHVIENVKKENDEITYESRVLQAALDEYDCQYRQLMSVVEELQCSSKQNQSAECLENLAQFTTSTLLEIKKELENRKICGMGDGSDLMKINSTIVQLREENSDLKVDCEQFYSELFKKLQSMRKENDMLRKAYKDFINTSKETMELLDVHKINIDGLRIKILDLENIIDTTARQSSQLEETMNESKLLIREIVLVREENAKMNSTINVLKNDEDREEVLREQILDYSRRLDMCEIENNSLRENLRSRGDDPSKITKMALEEAGYTMEGGQIIPEGDVITSGQEDAVEKAETSNLRKRGGSSVRYASSPPGRETSAATILPGTSLEPNKRESSSSSFSQRRKSESAILTLKFTEKGSATARSEPFLVSPRRGRDTARSTPRSIDRGSDTARLIPEFTERRSETARSTPRSADGGSDTVRYAQRRGSAPPISKFPDRESAPAALTPKYPEQEFCIPMEQTITSECGRAAKKLLTASSTRADASSYGERRSLSVGSFPQRECGTQTSTPSTLTQDKPTISRRESASQTHEGTEEEQIATTSKQGYAKPITSSRQGGFSEIFGGVMSEQGGTGEKSRLIILQQRNIAEEAYSKMFTPRKGSAAEKPLHYESDTEDDTFRNATSNPQELTVELNNILREEQIDSIKPEKPKPPVIPLISEKEANIQVEAHLVDLDNKGQPISNDPPLDGQERMKLELTKDSFNEFVATYALQMKHKVRHGASFKREVRAILDAFVVECGFCFCRDCVPKSKFYATCHQILHYGIQNISIKQLIYFHKHIYKIIDSKKPGWLLESLLEEKLGQEGLKCCQCKSTLCCTNSEEMLKEKVLKLEHDIALARTYLDDCKSYSSNTQLRNQYRVPGGQDTVSEQSDGPTYSIKSRFSTCRRIVGF